MRKGYTLGVVLVLLGGVCLSSSGILLRNVEQADGWQILFYRSIAFFMTLLVILVARYRAHTWRAFRVVGTRGLQVAAALGLGSICYVFAILHTTVANAVFIIGASPVIAALVGWVVLRERIPFTGVLAMLAAFAGIALMVAEGIDSGRWLGNLMAFLVVTFYVIFLLLLRDRRDVDMLPGTCMGGLVAAIVAGVMAGNLQIGASDLVIAVALGAVQFAGGFMLITIGTRFVPAAEVALFSLTEALLAPLWVWIGVDEVPGRMTAIGCVVVFGAMVSYSLIRMREDRPATRLP